MTALTGIPTREVKAAAIAPPSILWRELPNWLTASRVVMSLVFFAVLTFWRYGGSPASRGQTEWWLIFSASLFILASLTDVLDGYLARRWHVESAFGRIMDPFADKVLVIGALVFLAGPDFWLPTTEIHRYIGFGLQLSGVYPWMVVVIIGRELLVTSIRGVLEGQGVRFGADWSGKLKMFLQCVCVPTVLMTIGVTNVVPHAGGATWGRLLIDVVVWLTVIATLLSGVPYVFRAVGIMNDRRRLKRSATGSGADA